MTQRFNTQRGFNLIEAAIVLTIIGLVIGGIWLAASTVMNNMRKGELAEQTLQVVQNLRNLYANQQTTDGLTTVNANNAGIFPPSMRRQGTEVFHAFNAPVAIAAQGATGALNNQNCGNNTAGQQTCFSFQLNNVPRPACIEVLTRIAGTQDAARAIGFAGACNTNGCTTYGTQATFNTAQAATFCAADPVAAVVLHFSMRG